MRDGRGGAHAVERHLDGEDLRIRGRLHHEARDGVEGVVGVVHEHVTRANGAPHVGRRLESRHGVRRQRSVLEARGVDGGVELEEVGEGREAFPFEQVLGGELQLLEERGQDVGGQVAVVLQPHGRSEASLAQALLDAHEQVLAPAPRLQVRVPRDANGVARHDLVAVVDGGQVKPDHVLEQHERVLAGSIGQRHEARQHLARDVDDAERAVRQDRGHGGPDGGNQAERAIAEIRERVAGIDGERGEDGQEHAAEVVLEEALLLVARLLGPEQEDPLGGEEGLDLLQEAPVLLVHQFVHAGGHRGERLRGGHAVGPRRLVARGDAALEGGHPDHEELVQVRAEDGEELHALEQGHARVLSLFEHAPVEFEPRELPVHEGVGVHVSLDR